MLEIFLFTHGHMTLVDNQANNKGKHNLKIKKVNFPIWEIAWKPKLLLSHEVKAMSFFF